VANVSKWLRRNYSLLFYSLFFYWNTPQRLVLTWLLRCHTECSPVANVSKWLRRNYSLLFYSLFFYWNTPQRLVLTWLLRCHTECSLVANVSKWLRQYISSCSSTLIPAAKMLGRFSSLISWAIVTVYCPFWSKYFLCNIAS